MRSTSSVLPPVTVASTPTILPETLVGQSGQAFSQSVVAVERTESSGFYLHKYVRRSLKKSYAVRGHIVKISSDQANIGAGPAQRPNLSGDPYDGPRTPQQWFNTSVFSLSALFTFGNTHCNAVIGPDCRNLRLPALRSTRGMLSGCVRGLRTGQMLRSLHQSAAPPLSSVQLLTLVDVVNLCASVPF
jgi:hypothetical protein